MSGRTSRWTCLNGRTYAIEVNTMQQEVLDTIDPRQVGARLQEARRAVGKTQKDSADHLGIARTTVVAIEKGERRIRPQELIRLAGFYGQSLSGFLRSGTSAEPFAVQLRGFLGQSNEGEELAPHVWELQKLSEDYLELERLGGIPKQPPPPPEYDIDGLRPEDRAEDIATAERHRLGLGEGPILNLRELLDADLGLRIFFLPLPSKIAGLFAFTTHLGGCIAINGRHPSTRRRHSLCHELGHFLSHRLRPTVSHARYERRPQKERFAEAFARAFLLPASGLRRRFHEIRRQRRITPADLMRWSHIYSVSVEATARRLEELRLLPSGTWDQLRQQGFKVREAESLLGLEPIDSDQALLPPRYRMLAAEAFTQGKLSEGQLARFLRQDRLATRCLIRELEESGFLGEEPGDFDLSKPLERQRA